MYICSFFRQFIMVVGCLLIASTSPASPFRVNFSGNAEARYDDNIFFSNSDPTEDFITILSSTLMGGYITERAEVELSTGLVYHAYRDNRDQDNTDLKFDGAWRHRWTERLQTGLAASYIDDQRRDRTLDESGLLTTDAYRTAQEYSLNGQYSLSEVHSVSVAYQFQSEVFDDPTIDDLTGHTVVVGYSADLGRRIERTTGSVQARFSTYEYSNSSTLDYSFPIGTIAIDQKRNIDTYALSMGLGHAWTERLQFSLSAGARYTRFKSEIRQDNWLLGGESSSESDSWGGVGNLYAAYSGQTTLSSAALSHDLVPASGRNGLTERTIFRLNTSWRPYGEWLLGGGVDAYLNRSDSSGSTTDIDQLNMGLSGFIRYDLNRYWSLRLNYIYYDIEDRQDDTHRQRNRIGFSVGWNMPILE